MMWDTLTDWMKWSPQLLSGLTVSLQLTGLALLIGLPIGLLLALTSSSKNRSLRFVSYTIIEIGRGAPALVMLQMVYFGLPASGLTMGAFASGVIALALTTGAYTSEIIRAGLNAVAR